MPFSKKNRGELLSGLRELSPIELKMFEMLCDYASSETAPSASTRSVVPRRIRPQAQEIAYAAIPVDPSVFMYAAE